MVGAGEQKLCAAGDGTKFSNHKFVMVDGIVVQHIVPLKLPWVVDKVVVHGEVPDNDVGILHDAFQINRFMVVCARINFLWIHGFSLLSKLWKLVFFNLRKIIVPHIINGMFLR